MSRILDAIIPPPYQLLAKVVTIGIIVTAIAAGSYFAGRSHVQEAWDLQKAKDDKIIAELKANQGKETVRIVTQYVDRIKVVKEKGETIVQYVDKWITKENDAACILPKSFVVLHDSAAKNTVPGATGDTDAATDSGIKLSTATKTITGNYGTCWEWKEQVIALQEWIKAQQTLSNSK